MFSTLDRLPALNETIITITVSDNFFRKNDAKNTIIDFFTKKMNISSSEKIEIIFFKCPKRIKILRILKDVFLSH